MVRFARLASAALLGVLVTLSSLPAQGPAAGKDTLPALSYAELGQRVRSLQGKVVVVYLWSFG